MKEELDMKKFASFVVVVLFWCAGFAALPRIAALPEDASLTVEQALNVSAGLQQLSAQDGIDKEGRPTKVYYRFSPDLRIVIALNIDLGRNLQSRIEVAKNEIIMQKSGGSGKLTEETSPSAMLEISKLYQAPSRVNFYRIKSADLKLDENPIPGPVLSLIVPILDR